MQKKDREKYRSYTPELFALPTSLRARPAILGVLTGVFVLTYMFRIFGSPLFEGRQQPIVMPTVTANGADDSLDQPRILLVTALFQLPSSKPIEDTWLQHFLGEITSDIYIFTTPTLESLSYDTGL